MNLDWLEIGIVATALGLGGLLKGVTGVGLPLIAVPVMAIFLGVEHAVIVMVIPSIVTNLYQVVTHIDARHAVPEMPRVLAGGVFGAITGGVVLYVTSERVLALGLALWLIGYVAFRVMHPQFKLSRQARKRWSLWVGVSAGAMQAATGISVPIIVPYMDSLRLSARAYVFAVCLSFGAFSLVHCGLLIVNGSYGPDILGQSLLAVVPAIACVPLGVCLRRFVTPRAFDRLVRVTLLAIAAQLGWSAVA